MSRSSVVLCFRVDVSYLRTRIYGDLTSLISRAVLAIVVSMVYVIASMVVSNSIAELISWMCVRVTRWLSSTNLYRLLLSLTTIVMAVLAVIASVVMSDCVTKLVTRMCMCVARWLSSTNLNILLLSLATIIMAVLTVVASM